MAGSPKGGDQMVKKPDRTGVLREAGVRFPGYRPSEAMGRKHVNVGLVVEEKVL